jgi:hypothetical protein
MGLNYQEMYFKIYFYYVCTIWKSFIPDLEYLSLKIMPLNHDLPTEYTTGGTPANRGV